jgi:hypothetical protein
MNAKRKEWHRSCPEGERKGKDTVQERLFAADGPPKDILKKEQKWEKKAGRMIQRYCSSE